MTQYKCGIYKIENKLNHKIYIGQSIDIQRRFLQHKRKKDQCWIHLAIQKYGVENFTWQIIEQCNENQLDEKEKYWINYYRSFGEGYNQNSGGKDQALYTAINNSKKTVIQYTLNGEKVAIFKSTRQAERCTGILHIAEVCRHERAQAGNYVWLYEGDKFKKPQVRKKKVQQINPITFQVINTYNSIKQASENTPTRASAISQVCLNKRKTAGGFNWRYLNE